MEVQAEEAEVQVSLAARELHEPELSVGDGLSTVVEVEVEGRATRYCRVGYGRVGEQEVEEASS